MLIKNTASLAQFVNLLKTIAILFVIIDNKGGVCKSALAATIKALLDRLGIEHLLMSTDTSNADMAQYGDTLLIDVRNKKQEGILPFAAEKVVAGDRKCVILDVAARDETHISRQLGRISSELAEQNSRMVVLRPITLNPFNQNNAMHFVTTTMTDHMAVILVRILCQGRTEEDFIDWDRSLDRRKALDAGAVEMNFIDASAKFADMAVGFGLTFYDIAVGAFEKADKPGEVDSVVPVAVQVAKSAAKTAVDSLPSANEGGEPSKAKARVKLMSELARDAFEGPPQMVLRDWCEEQHEKLAIAVLKAVLTPRPAATKTSS